MKRSARLLALLGLALLVGCITIESGDDDDDDVSDDAGDDASGDDDDADDTDDDTGNDDTCGSYVLLAEDWETGGIDLTGWEVTGEPAPVISTNAHGGLYALNVNGDATCLSGLLGLPHGLAEPGTCLSAWVNNTTSGANDQAVYMGFVTAPVMSGPCAWEDFERVLLAGLSNQIVAEAPGTEYYTEPFDEWGTWVKVELRITQRKNLAFYVNDVWRWTSETVLTDMDNAFTWLWGGARGGPALIDDIRLVGPDGAAE